MSATEAPPRATSRQVVTPARYLVRWPWAMARLPAASDTLTRSYACLHLLPTAPPERVRLAHRYAARTHHPARGGNTSGMAAINAAIETIRAHQERR